MSYLNAVILLLICGCEQAWANIVAPADVSTTISRSFDRGALPDNVVIWNLQSGGYDTDSPAKWSRNTLVCFSSTVATNGMCRTKPSWFHNGTIGYEYIPLTFTLKNTSMSVDLTLKASHTNGGCYSHPSTVAGICESSNAETNFTFKLPNTELAKIPYPGEWHATLKQKLMQWGPRVQLAVWQADITLHVSDISKQTIYFPSFPYGHPAVDLNLNNLPGTSNNTTASGNSSLDMCLYDGALHADNITLTFADEGKSAPGRDGGQFSVYRQGGNPAQASDRLDYVLKVLNPITGNTETVSNGSQIQWTGVNARSNQRQVVMQGIPGISFCVPAPLSFMTPAFMIADKNAGRYTGKLIVTYSPKTSVP